MNTVLTYEWSVFRGREALPDGHEEHGHGEERRNAQRHLLAGLGGDVEDEQR